MQATCVVDPVKGIEADELFRVTPTADGLLHLTGLPQAMCDERAVPRTGFTLSPRQPFRVRIGNREWSITASNEVTEQRAADDLFGRIQASRRVEDRPVNART
jgi:hypothetical protein